MGAEARRQGLDAGVHQIARRARLNRIVDVDGVDVRRERERFDPASGFEPTGPVDEPHHAALRCLGLERVVAGRHRVELWIGLNRIRAHAKPSAVLDDMPRLRHGAATVGGAEHAMHVHAWVQVAEVLPRRATVELADAGCANAGGHRRAQGEISRGPPQQASLVAGRRARTAVVRAPRRNVQAEVVRERRPGEQRRVHLHIELGDIESAASAAGWNASGLAPFRHRIRLERSLVPAPFEAEREGKRAGRQIDDVAFERTGHVRQRLLAEVALHEADVAKHLFGNRTPAIRPLAAEEVEGHAARRRRADARLAQGHSELGRVVGALLLLPASILAPVGGKFPEQRPPTQCEFALQHDIQEPCVHLLLEDPRAGFQRSPPEEDQAAVGDRELGAEGVVALLGGNDDVLQNRVAAATAEAERFRRASGGRLAPRIGRLGEQTHRAAELVAQRGEEVEALIRRQQIVEAIAVVVEAVAGGEAVEVAARRLRRVERRPAHAVVQRAVVQRDVGAAEVRPENEPPLRREGRAAAILATRAERAGERRLGAIRGVDLAFVDVGEARQHAPPARFSAPPERVEPRRRAIAFGEIAARLQGNAQAVESVARDDVDHAADGIRAVDRRGAVVEYLDALDDAGRQRVEIHRARHSGGGCAGDPAPPIDQHQRSLRAEIAQRHPCRASADAVAVLGEAGVARHVEAGIDRRTGNRQLLQHGAQVGEPGTGEIVARQRGEGRDLLQRIDAANARTGDHDLLDPCRIRALSGARLRRLHAQAGRHEASQSESSAQPRRGLVSAWPAAVHRQSVRCRAPCCRWSP